MSPRDCGSSTCGLSACIFAQMFKTTPGGLPLSASAKRPELPAIPRPRVEAYAPDDDDIIKRRLRDASGSLGFGTRATHAETPHTPTPTTPLTPCKSFNLSVPEYLFDELGLQAVKRRVTKRYLILEALAKAGYSLQPQDLEEDGRRRR